MADKDTASLHVNEAQQVGSVWQHIWEPKWMNYSV